MMTTVSTGDERTDWTVLAQAVARARAEFLEMPGLQLTLPQAARLWGLERAVCLEVLLALVEARFLTLTSKAIFTRPGGI